MRTHRRQGRPTQPPKTITESGAIHRVKHCPRTVVEADEQPLKFSPVRTDLLAAFPRILCLNLQKLMLKAKDPGVGSGINQAP
jgi:hypothetical protein